MLGQTPLPDEKPSPALQVETDQTPLSQDDVSGRSIRFLWTGFGIAVTLLIAASAYALLPLVPHVPAKSLIILGNAFNPSLPGLSPGSARSARHPGSAEARPRRSSPAVPPRKKALLSMTAPHSSGPAGAAEDVASGEEPPTLAHHKADSVNMAYPVELDEMQSLFPGSNAWELERFLHKKRGDVGKASKTYQSFLDWQRQTLPITASDVGAAADFLWLHRKAKDATDILFVQGAKYDPDTATPEEYSLLVARIMSSFPPDSKQKLTVLVDVRSYEGLPSVAAIKLMPFFRLLFPLMNDFFPGRMQRAIVYPVPRAAAAVWPLVRNFMSSSTASKVLLLPGSDKAGSPVPSELWDYIDIEDLSQSVQGFHRKGL